MSGAARASKPMLPAHLVDLRKGMSLAEKVGQITQLDIMEILDCDAAEQGRFELDASKLAPYVEAGVGSFLNSPTAGGAIGKLVSPSAEQWRGALAQLRKAYTDAGKVPPIFGIDSMHGANYVHGAPMFPHALHVAASFDPRHAHATARSAARHTRAAGIPWVFAPVLDVAVAARFPRVYESAGEDPVMAAIFGAAIVQGLQGMPLDTAHLRRVVAGADEDAAAEGPVRTIPTDLSGDDVVAACMKHFIGYQASRSGYDRAPAWLPETFVRQHFLPPFQAAIDAGVATAMLSYNSPVDTPAVISRTWSRRWLRGDAGFSGLVVTDWLEVYNQLDWHRSAATRLEAVVQALQRGSTDLAMVPYNEEFLQDGQTAVKEGYVAEARIDIAVDRVLALKQRVGLLGATDAAESSDTPQGDEALRRGEEEASAEAAVDGVVLLKNDGGALPLDIGVGGTVAVVGPSAQSAVNLLGGWSVHWIGPDSEAEVPYRTVAQALADDGVAVAAATGVTVAGEPADDDALAAAREATAAILFVYGEGAYAEVFGDSPTGYLPPAQLTLAQAVATVARERQVPLVGVYVGGRDRLVAQFDALFDAHMAAFYPGPHGGAAVSRVVRGAASPGGRLPVTMHAADAQDLPYWRAHADYTSVPPAVVHTRAQDAPLYPFGHGLSYTTFAALDIHVAVHSPRGGPNNDSAPAADVDPEAPLMFAAHDVLTVRVTVVNTGARAGAWPVLLFVGDDACISPPPPPMLRGFEKVRLDAGASTTVTFKVTMEDLAFEASDDIIDGGGRFVQPGTFTIAVEGLDRQVCLKGDPLMMDDWVALRRGAFAQQGTPDSLY